MTEIEMQKGFYNPVCTKEEIERIFNVQTPSDFLLKLRADTIVDNMRLFRVYRNKAIANPENWSLEKSFVTKHYDSFLKNIEQDKLDICKSVNYSNIFSTETNGFLYNNEFGNIITISDSLQYFFKFMNLGLLEFGRKVPKRIAINSIRIAIRVMLQSEALDFLMDPRGIITRELAIIIHNPIQYQMQFIAGHEFAHLLLGHLDNKKLCSKPLIKSLFSGCEDYGSEKFYNHSQKNEFEADIKSIEFANYGNIERIKVFEAALLWFASLDLHEAVENYIFPPMGRPTHPPARDRFENLLQKIPMKKNYNYTKWLKLISLVEELKKLFIEEVGYNIEQYEMYGSVYLDKPNTKWRGKELIDRVDYY